ILFSEDRRLRRVAEVGLPREVEVAIGGSTREREQIVRCGERRRLEFVMRTVDATQRDAGIEIDGEVKLGPTESRPYVHRWRDTAGVGHLIGIDRPSSARRHRGGRDAGDVSRPYRGGEADVECAVFVID